MQPLPQRGVPIAERDSSPQAPATPDWDAVHTFLEVVRRGSFRSASDHLGISINALRRRISDLESQLGVTLLTRHVDGVRTHRRRGDDPACRKADGSRIVRPDPRA